MSLIPSESYSFPDHFTSTVTPSRRPKQEKPERERVRKKPEIVALPDPEPEPVLSAEPAVEPEVVPQDWEPEVPEIKAPPAPNPALRRVHAPPPRIPEAPVRKIPLPASLKPKVRWNNRATPIDPTANRNNGNANGATEFPSAPLPPAQNVIPMRAARPAPVRPPQHAIRPAAAIPQIPVQPAPPRKPAPVATEMRPVALRPAAGPVKPTPAPRKPVAPAVSGPQADFFEMFAEDGHGVAVKRRREMKFRRFIAYEAAALLVLLPLVILGLTLNISTPVLRWIMNILTIAAAFAAVVIPIAFYAFTPTLPELER